MKNQLIANLLLVIALAHVTYSKCPFRCYCTKNGVFCHGVTRFPDFSSLPSWTMNISIYEMNIPSIPAAAFKGLQNVKTISMYDGYIGQIQPCAFQGLNNVERVELYNLNIKSIEMYAFSDMRNVKSFNIYKSTVDYINSYAFYNIRGVQSMTLQTLKVKRVESNAFYAIRAVDTFYMYGNNITTIKRRAFSHSSFETVNMFYNYIVNLECQTIDVLKSESKHDFNFYANELFCGCHMAWLLQPQNRGLLDSSRGPVKCAGPSSRLKGRKAAQLMPAELDCRKKPFLTARRLQCPPVNVPPPAMTQARQCLKRY